MSTMKPIFALTLGALLLAPVTQAQSQVKPTRPDGPQVQPPRPGGPQIQPPRPVGPQPVRPRPPRPEIQPPRPPRPVRPQPVRPIRPIRPIIVNPGWGHGNPGWAYGHAILYSGSHFRGHYLTIRSSAADLRQYGFDNRTMSLHARGRWQICSEPHYRGNCVTLHDGSPSFGRLAGRVSSIRYLGN